jgi:hypothetical protein
MKNQMQRGSRATTIDELKTIMDQFWDQEARERGHAFKPEPSEIVLSPYPKSGTTWLMQIVHGLRTRGSMEFDEINDVIPWITIAYDVGWDLDAPQVAEPRVFHIHASWHDVPKGAHYIIPFRHYHDLIVSFYRFFEGWFFEPGTISLETFISWRWPRDEMNNQGYWYHLSSWWEQRHNQNVLLLCYEDMKVDLPGSVQKIAHFMDIALDDDLLEIVTRQSSREFMLAHRHQFDEHLLVQIGGRRAGLPPSKPRKITSGTSNKARYQLSSALKKELDDIWSEQIQPKFGFKNYEELRQSLKDLP